MHPRMFSPLRDVAEWQRDVRRISMGVLRVAVLSSWTEAALSDVPVTHRARELLRTPHISSIIRMEFNRSVRELPAPRLAAV